MTTMAMMLLWYSPERLRRAEELVLQTISQYTRSLPEQERDPVLQKLTYYSGILVLNLVDFSMLFDSGFGEKSDAYLGRQIERASR